MRVVKRITFFMLFILLGLLCMAYQVDRISIKTNALEERIRILERRIQDV